MCVEGGSYKREARDQSAARTGGKRGVCKRAVSRWYTGVYWCKRCVSVLVVYARCVVDAVRAVWRVLRCAEDSVVLDCVRAGARLMQESVRRGSSSSYAIVGSAL